MQHRSGQTSVERAIMDKQLILRVSMPNNPTPIIVGGTLPYTSIITYAINNIPDASWEVLEPHEAREHLCDGIGVGVFEITPNPVINNRRRYIAGENLLDFIVKLGVGVLQPAIGI